MRTADLVVDFLAAQRGRRAPNTLATYRSDLRQVTAALPGPIGDITAQAKTPRLLRPEQRQLFTRVPDLSVREIARHYTFSPADLAIIARHRRDANRLGFAVQLALLRFPGRSLTDVPEVPAAILTHIAE